MTITCRKNGVMRENWSDLLSSHNLDYCGANIIIKNLTQSCFELTKPVANSRFVFETGACFVAGTLVHTKEGLKPIEQLKVGDWVLSRPENPVHGTQTDYKRVVKTMVHHDKPVIFGTFNRTPGSERPRNYGKVETIIMTPDHPFWVQGVGWTAARLLREGILFGYPKSIRFIGIDGESLNGGFDGQVLVTKKPGHGWLRYAGPFGQLGENGGYLYDMRTATQLPAEPMWDMFDDLLSEDPNPPSEILDFDDPIHQKYIYRTTVYNIEVEDWHTYFVGENGIWVHNANCAGLQALLNSNLFRQVLERMGSGLNTVRLDANLHPKLP